MTERLFKPKDLVWRMCDLEDYVAAPECPHVFLPNPMIVARVDIEPLVESTATHYVQEYRGRELIAIHGPYHTDRLVHPDDVKRVLDTLCQQAVEEQEEALASVRAATGARTGDAQSLTLDIIAHKYRGDYDCN